MNGAVMEARSAADVWRELERVDEQLSDAKARLPIVLESSAKAFLGGRSDDEVNSVRTQIRRLSDLSEGLRRLALRTELDELSSEIERRKREYAGEAVRVRELKCADRVSVEFREYEQASLAHNDDAREIANLEDRLNALEGELD